MSLGHMAKIRHTKKTHGLIDSQKRITVEVKVDNLLEVRPVLFMYELGWTFIDDFISAAHT
jgi:hypothetical protein